MSEGILSAIGKTPLVRLHKFLPGSRFRLFAKVEALNPGGSIKDRPALQILEQAMADGQIGPETVVIESSSGNMGIGLAQACRYHGLRFVCVVDPKASPQNVKVLSAYGAEIVAVGEPDPETGEWLQARLNTIARLRDEIGDCFWPNQYKNLDNPSSHQQTTMMEVAEELDYRVDYLFVATSTCGTIRGCGEFIREHGMNSLIVAVDAKGSLIFSSVQIDRNIPGLGAGLRPEHCDPSLIDSVEHVDDLDCINGCRKLVHREAILAGGSSGGVMAAVERWASRISEGANCVAVLPDRGERYLETVYDDRWLTDGLGIAADRVWRPQPEVGDRHSELFVHGAQIAVS